LEKARVSLFQGPSHCQVGRAAWTALLCPYVVTCACWLVGHREKCHFPLYFRQETASVGFATLLHISGTLGQTPGKPSRSCLWAHSGWPVIPSLQDPCRKDLGAISPNQTWLLLGAGLCFPAYHCGYGRQRIRCRV